MAVFRPSLLLGTMAVLMLGIVPPLLIYGIVRAVEAAVERTRIRALGLSDPLAAAEALNRLKQREQSPTMMMTALSVGGVGVGVMALIVVLSVMSGFEMDLQQKILGTHAHAVVTKYAGDLPEYPKLMEQIAKVPGVVGQSPFIINQVMIVSDGNVDGVVIKGIDPDTVGAVTDLPAVHAAGRLAGVPEHARAHPPRPTRGAQGSPMLDDRPADGQPPRPRARRRRSEEEIDPIIGKPTKPAQATVLPGIILGRELAASLRVVVGDRVNIVSPLGTELGPQGPIPKSRAFRVAGIFYSGMYEYDSKFVYISLGEAAELLRREGRQRHRAQGGRTWTTRAASPPRWCASSAATPTGPATGAR